ncbi:hypothetical protein RRG08_042467 [Elysia crispata]|uniref:Integrase catalytic domain-containing protein n=1 Tax=Elysia crispata TaxID=231223 RepID=A0AAE0ZC52_9GAST|nr:hypothetical protein RRG08_042467 [Elysia crispata]
MKKTRTTAYHPAGNGQTECYNKTMFGLLRTLTPAEKKNWPRLLPELVFWYNTTAYSTTGHSPYLLLFGREPWLPIDDFVESGWDHLHQRLRITYTRIARDWISYIVSFRIRIPSGELPHRLAEVSGSIRDPTLPEMGHTFGAEPRPNVIVTTDDHLTP